jgi:hypothetical protein
VNVSALLLCSKGQRLFLLPAESEKESKKRGAFYLSDYALPSFPTLNLLVTSREDHRRRPLHACGQNANSDVIGNVHGTPFSPRRKFCRVTVIFSREAPSSVTERRRV